MTTQRKPVKPTVSATVHPVNSVKNNTRPLTTPFFHLHAPSRDKGKFVAGFSIIINRF